MDVLPSCRSEQSRAPPLISPGAEGGNILQTDADGGRAMNCGWPLPPSTLRPLLDDIRTEIAMIGNLVWEVVGIHPTGLFPRPAALRNLACVLAQYCHAH